MVLNLFLFLWGLFCFVLCCYYCYGNFVFKKKFCNNILQYVLESNLSYLKIRSYLKIILLIYYCESEYNVYFLFSDRWLSLFLIMELRMGNYFYLFYNFYLLKVRFDILNIVYRSIGSFYMFFILVFLVLFFVNNLMFFFQFLYLVMNFMLQFLCEWQYWFYLRVCEKYRWFSGGVLIFLEYLRVLCYQIQGLQYKILLSKVWLFIFNK